MYGLTPIHYAANSGHLQMVKTLIDEANVFTQDNEGIIPIRRAVLLGTSQVVDALSSTMEAAGENCTLRSQLTGDLAVAALDTSFWKKACF